jgi:hypothetical protein
MNKTTTARQTKQPVAPREAENRQPAQDIIEYLKDYARERPEVAALWCFGIGFVLGWKLKPW